MEDIKRNWGGSRTGAGRKESKEKKITIKIPLLKSLVEAKGGEEKARQIMIAAFITSPI